MAGLKQYAGPPKLVVAFDIGATFSGISYCIPEPGQVPKILEVARFPGQELVRGDAKVPSLLYYDKEGNVKAAGAEVVAEATVEVALTEGWTKAEWWKLHLRPKHLASSINIKDDLPPLPPRRSAIDVLTDFIKYLFQCTKTYIQENHAAFTWSSIEDSIEYVFTLPNGWEAVQQPYRQAIERAGLVPVTPVGQSRVHILTEGKAALHFCVSNLSAEMVDQAVPQGVVIIDAGGATVDLSMFSMTSNPISCEEIAPAECRLQGSVFVSRQAKTLLQRKLEGWEHSSPEDIAECVREFDESAKLVIKSDREPSFVRVAWLRVRDAKYDIAFGKLKLSGEEATGLFNNSIDAIIGAFEQQQKFATMLITTAFLVGGLSTNDWVWTQLQSYFKAKNMNIYRPVNHINNAISNGAMLSYVTDKWGLEARVEVNQRALIDKVLGRYSGEFTLFRELLQNSDDAESSYVEIHFETAAYRRCAKREDTYPLLKLTDTEVVQWTYRNNGKPFDREDWDRLPRIAEGNPSPDKVGAFGVGFYSLFSVTKSPYVKSGGYEMRFYWKDNDNQLYVRRRDLSHEELDTWTTFEMPLREPGSMPPLLDLLQFLTSSITFMVNLRAVGVFLDGHHLGRIKKSPGPSRTINIPTEMERFSPKNIMHVKEVQHHCIMIEVEVMNAVYTCSGVTNPSSMELNKSRVDLMLFTAEVDVKLDKKISAELHRCMQKKPPSRLKYSLIYTGKDEYDRSAVQQPNSHPEEESVFRGLRADLEGAKYTRIFIGHATRQTTSVGGHMASHFIPTVERESIDLVDNYVSIWNTELLYVGGFLSRVVYEMELSDIQHLWERATAGAPNSPSSLGTQDHLHRRFLHVLKFFAFHHSTPSEKVCEMLRDSFYKWSASALPIKLLSSIGVCAARDIRVFDSQVAKFLNSIPMLPEYVSREAEWNVKALPDSQKVSPVTIKDVLQALNGHPLCEEKLVFCLQWWLELKQNNPRLDAAELLTAVAFVGAGETVWPLSSMEYFVDIKSHKFDGPLPTSLIPIHVSTHIPSTELRTLGWREFTVIDWLQYISRTDVMSRDPTYDFTRSPDWAERVLCTLSRAWSSLPDEMRGTAKVVFKGAQCIPTSDGLHYPDGSYLPGANHALFHTLGLPVVTLTAGDRLDGETKTLLLFIGVRTQIPIDLLLMRLLDTGDWSIYDLIDYLLQSSSSLTAEDISMLKLSKLFSKECMQDSTGKERYCADKLYPPLEIFRQLQLPVIAWHKSKWSNESNEAALLYHLGLRPFPPLETIIKLCASPDVVVGAIAFKYFCDNLRSKYSEYNPDKFQDVAFIPAENKEGACLKCLGDVFLGIQWRALGFPILQNAYQKIVISEIGIQEHPPPSRLLHLLETTRPSNEEIARQWYECLSDRIQSFTRPELAKLSELLIVPTNYSGSQAWLAPSQCYLGPPSDPFYLKLFVFVNFGTKANHFLGACGLAKEPSVEDVAECLIRDPDRFHELAGGHIGFLEKLRDLAAQKTRIPIDTLHRMSSQRTLLGRRREKTSDQAGWKTVYDLRTPKEIVVIDDDRDYLLFSDAVFVAPQDELLERFYSSIGCRQLSTVIQERYEDSLEIPDTKTCSKIQTLILQRLPLFLKKCSHSCFDKMRIPSPSNFSVFACKRLLVHKALIIGDDKTPREQDLWATIKYDKAKGSIELWLSHHVTQDIYDLAVSLCRLLFGSVKINDTLLLATMLSDIGLLKRAGFEVDEFSEQRLCELPVDESSTITMGNPHPSMNSIDDQDSPPQAAPAYTLHSVVNTLSKTYYMVKNSLASTARQSTALGNIMRLLLPQRPHQVIHQDYIRNIVNMATEACALRGSHLLNDEDDKIQFLKHHSCNDFVQFRSLRSVCTREDVEFHAAEDLADVNALIMNKEEPLARFIRIIRPAASAYRLPMNLLHIFYDACEGPIAFNLERSIYLNLRYFEEWHDEDVRNGRLRQAQLSWFFVLAHEIAHNLTPSHDSVHEFWFAAICEAHISDFFAAIVSDA